MFIASICGSCVVREIREEEIAVAVETVTEGIVAVVGVEVGSVEDIVIALLSAVVVVVQVAVVTEVEIVVVVDATLLLFWRMKTM